MTLGIGEPFTTTLTVTLIFALILSLPVLLLQAYGFVMPAVRAPQRRRMLPVTLAIPFLFIAGVTFGYLVVLPAALHFFQNFNSGEFNVLVQASQYYKFAATTLLAMGLLFQVPVAIIAVTRAGLVTQRSCATTAATRYSPAAWSPRCSRATRSRCCSRPCPLYLLFELSVLVASISDRRAATRRARARDREATGDTRSGAPEGAI